MSIYEDLETMYYGITLKAIYPNSTTYGNFERFIETIEIHSSYEDYVFPIITLKLKLNRNDYVKIQQNAERILFLLSIKRYKAKTLNEPTNAMIYDIYIDNEVLKPYDIPRTTIPPVPKSVKVPNNEKTDNSLNELFDMEVSCFLKRHMDYNKQPNMGVFCNTSMNDLILYLLNNNNVNNNVIMEECDNELKYNQVILPPLSMTNSINFLQEVYGCYKFGILTFFDIKYNYILAKNKIKNKPEIKGLNYDKYSKVYIELKGMEEANVGSRIDKENNMLKVIINDTSDFIINDTSVREIGGEVVKFMSRTSLTNSIGRNYKIMYGIENDGTITNSEYPKELVKYNNYSNQYIETEYESNLTRSQLIATITWSDLDLDLFMPHKSFYLMFNTGGYKRYSGDYNLVGNTVIFNKGMSDKKFRCYGASSFMKINKNLQE